MYGQHLMFLMHIANEGYPVVVGLSEDDFSTQPHPVSFSRITSPLQQQQQQQHQQQQQQQQHDAPKLPVSFHQLSIEAPAPLAPAPDLVQAIEEFSTDDPRKLTFPEGAVMILRQKGETGWWLCEYNGATGWVPASFLVTLPPSSGLIQVQKFEAYDQYDDDAQPPVPQRPSSRRTSAEPSQTLADGVTRPSPGNDYAQPKAYNADDAPPPIPSRQ